MSEPTTRRAFMGRAARSAGGIAALAALRDARAESASELDAFRRDRAAVNGFDDLAAAYDLAPGVTYLNHASIGTIPRVVRRARDRYLRICESNPWLHIWGDAWGEQHEQTRVKAARLLGCDVDEVAITRNTTEGFNLLAQGLSLGPRDQVVFSSLNHVGASACWEHVAETRGFDVRRFDFPVGDIPGLGADDVVRIHAEQLSDPTSLLVLPHIDNTVGLRHPVREITAAAHETGVSIVAVDAAQSVGMIPVNVREMGVDVYATSAHKWLQSPKGLGLLYVRREVQERLRPMIVTWGRRRFADSARKYEDYGTRDLGTIITLADAIDFQESLGAAEKQTHCRGLWQTCRERVDATPGLTWRSPRDWTMGGSLCAVEVAGRPSGEVFEELYREHGLVFRPFATEGLNTIRISPNAMNTTADLDRLFGSLTRAS